jgi:serine/threonine protein kinase
VIHRDIKPANILIHKGIAKITDFGFARVVDDVDESVAITFLGTPLYMAPQILAK